MDQLETYWMKRARFFTQMLIISGALNIGFVSAFLHSTWKEKFSPISYEVVKDAPRKMLNNQQLLRMYSKAPFDELLFLLQSREAVEEGYAKRDLALAVLASRDDLDVSKALGGIPLQKRLIAFLDPVTGTPSEMVAFAGLEEEHFLAIDRFVQVEHWPLTAKGLFKVMKSKELPYDPSLLAAFYCTTEFRSLFTLIQKNIPLVDPSLVVALVQEGTWEALEGVVATLRQMQSYTEETFLHFLTSYALEQRSSIAAYLLLECQAEHVLRRFNDKGLVAFLDLFVESPEKIILFARKLLVSQRSDSLRKKAAEILYKAEGSSFPQSYDYLQTVYHFFPEKAQMQEVKVIAPPPVSKHYHKVAKGESLWKIARRYKVTIRSIVELNHLESDRLRIGKELEIPAESR